MLKNVENVRSREEKSRFSSSNHTEEIQSVNRKIKGDCTIGYVPVGVINLTEEKIVLPKGYSLGIASEVEIEGYTIIERNEIIDNHTGCSINIVKSKREEKFQFENYLKEKLSHLDEVDAQVISKVLRDNSDLFYKEGSRDIGCSSQVKHEINTGNAHPVKKQPYRLAHSLKPVVEEQIKDMLKKGIIVEISSSWNSPIVMVKKKSTSGTLKYRLCVDLRGLNALTKPDAYPLSNIMDTLDSLGQCKVFKVLDMASGHLQIEIEEKDKEKTAFSTPQGHFHFNKMCCGLMNAPATYQRCMESILLRLR